MGILTYNYEAGTVTRQNQQYLNENIDKYVHHGKIKKERNT